MRKLGYHFRERDKKKSEIIFIRPLERNGYPRFHLYLKINEDRVIFNLHLDQKKPTYKGSPAHSAEYEGKVVEEEIERIKEICNIEN
jgi:hypothetical protein